MWVKLGRKQTWGHDDTVVSLAFLTALIHISSVFWAINNGFGEPLKDIDPTNLHTVEAAMYTSELSYVVTIGLTRVATALFIANLTRHKPQVRMSYILGGISILWLVASTLAIALRGDLSQPWATLDGSGELWARWIVVEIAGLVVEIGLWFMSLSLVWGLQMRLSKRVLILGAFGGRLLIAPILAGRLYLLSPGENDNATWTSVLPGILTEAALEYSLIATSITALKPFLRPFHTGAIVNSVGGAGSGLMYGSAAYRGGQGVYMRSGSKSVDQKEEYQMTTTSDAEPVGQARGSGDEFGLRSAVDNRPTQLGTGPSRPRREDEESVESVGSEKMIIRTTKDWSVRYEERHAAA